MSPGWNGLVDPSFMPAILISSITLNAETEEVRYKPYTSIACDHLLDVNTILVNSGLVIE
jgi:hypothetical protein